MDNTEILVECPNWTICDRLDCEHRDTHIFIKGNCDKENMEEDCPKCEIVSE